jgi:hypothetical protein
MDERAEQYSNVHRSIFESLEPDSKVTVESPVHAQKQPAPSNSTDARMQIDARDKQELNADDSITESFEPGSNRTIERFLHVLKQDSPRTSRHEGREIDESE